MVTNYNRLKLKSPKDDKRYLTDKWDACGVQQSIEYAILTDEISRAWSDMTARQYKRLRGPKKEK